MYQLSAGTVLQNGKYRIERVLGQGGFGITYLANDSVGNRLVAIKEFFPESLCCRKSNNFVDTLSATQTPLISKFKKKFIKEANRIKALSHPNIIRCYEAFEENGTAYYVMEYVEGYNLNEFVSQRGSYSIDSANDIINQIGSALTYIHQQRMTHLDVKPANIVWSTQKRKPILIDFGISKQYDFSGEATSTTPVGFSKGYAPIEQYAQGGVNEFSPQTDVYSLAATYYYLLTGKNPPEATEIIMSGLSNPGGKISQSFSTIRKAMSPKKADRYSSVAGFIQALSNNLGQHKNSNDSIEATVVQYPQRQEQNKYINPQRKDSNEKSKNRQEISHSWRNWSWIIAIVISIFVVVNSFAMAKGPTPEDTFWKGIMAAVIFGIVSLVFCYFLFSRSQALFKKDEYNYKLGVKQLLCFILVLGLVILSKFVPEILNLPNGEQFNGSYFDLYRISRNGIADDLAFLSPLIPLAFCILAIYRGRDDLMFGWVFALWMTMIWANGYCEPDGEITYKNCTNMWIRLLGTYAILILLGITSFCLSSGKTRTT